MVLGHAQVVFRSKVSQFQIQNGKEVRKCPVAPSTLFMQVRTPSVVCDQWTGDKADLSTVIK